MLRKLFFLTVLILCSFDSSSNTACAGSLQVDETPAINDSIMITDKVEVSIKLEIPSFPSEQIRNMALEWVNEMLGGIYPGSYDNPKVMIDWYALRWKKELMKAYEEEFMDSGVTPYRNASVRMVDSTPSFVTLLYGYITFDDLGRPDYYDLGVTIRLSDGRRMDWGIVNETDETLQRLMRKGVKKYWDISDSEFVRLPTCAPLFTQEGIKFVYDAGEIAMYAVGPIEFTIPYSQIKPCLNQTALRLIGQ